MNSEDRKEIKKRTISWSTCFVYLFTCLFTLFFPRRLESLQPELLSVFGEMPSLEDNLSSRLKDLVRSKEQEKQVSSDQYRQATAQAARLQTQLEEKE